MFNKAIFRYHVVVKGLHVRDGKEVSTQWKSGAAFLRCMVWKVSDLKIIKNLQI